MSNPIVNLVALKRGGTAVSFGLSIEIFDSSFKQLSTIQTTFKIESLFDAFFDILIAYGKASVLFFNKKGKRMKTLQLASPVTSILQYDRKTIAFGLEYYRIHFYDINEAFDCVRTVTEPHIPWSMIKYENYLVSASNKTAIRVLDMSPEVSTFVKKELKGHRFIVRKLANLIDRRIASFDRHDLRIWEMTFYTTVMVINDMAFIGDFIVLRDGRIVCGGKEDVINIYDPIRDYEISDTLKRTEMGLFSLCEMSDGMLLSYDSGREITRYGTNSKS
jgi:WD40 repeat protein